MNTESSAEPRREALNPGQVGGHAGWLSLDGAGFKAKHMVGVKAGLALPKCLCASVDAVGFACAIISFSSWYKAAQETRSRMMCTFFSFLCALCLI